jgi:hypothetical protein
VRVADGRHLMGVRRCRGVEQLGPHRPPLEEARASVVEVDTERDAVQLANGSQRTRVGLAEAVGELHQHPEVVRSRFDVAVDDGEIGTLEHVERGAVVVGQQERPVPQVPGHVGIGCSLEVQPDGLTASGRLGDEVAPVLGVDPTDGARPVEQPSLASEAGLAVVSELDACDDGASSPGFGDLAREAELRRRPAPAPRAPDRERAERSGDRFGRGDRLAREHAGIDIERMVQGIDEGAHDLADEPLDSAALDGQLTHGAPSEVAPTSDAVRSGLGSASVVTVRAWRAT